MNITIKEAQDWAFSLLKKNNIENSNMEAEALIRYIFGWDRTKFFMNMREEMPEDMYELLTKLVSRRIQHEPLQYIVGSQEFYGRDFTVNQSVLIPRPETELLIENLLIEAEKIFAKSSVTVVDVGTGSGAIALTLALEKSDWQVHTVDISSEAIVTARKNAKSLDADVTFHHGDLVDPIIEKDIKVDILISNPPYIPSADVLELMPDVKEYEPKLALDGGEDGLDFYRKLIEQSKTILKEKAIVAFEIGINQSKAIEELLYNAGAKKVTIKQDFQGIDRCVFAFFR